MSIQPAFAGGVEPAIYIKPEPEAFIRLIG
jgi:hypothetical protein